MLKFNRARDTVHQRQWLKAIEELKADGLESDVAPSALLDEENEEHNSQVSRVLSVPAAPTRW